MYNINTLHSEGYYTSTCACVHILHIEENCITPPCQDSVFLFLLFFLVLNKYQKRPPAETRRSLEATFSQIQRMCDSGDVCVRVTGFNTSLTTANLSFLFKKSVHLLVHYLMHARKLFLLYVYFFTAPRCLQNLYDLQTNAAEPCSADLQFLELLFQDQNHSMVHLSLGVYCLFVCWATLKF